MTMTLDEIVLVDVRLDLCPEWAVCYKYVAALLTDKKTGASKKIIRAFPGMNHMEIIAEIRMAVGDQIVVAGLGGGFVDVNPIEKTIRLNGVSTTYGEDPDRSETMSMIEKTYPDFSVKSE